MASARTALRIRSGSNSSPVAELPEPELHHPGIADVRNSSNPARQKLVERTDARFGDRERKHKQISVPNVSPSSARESPSPRRTASRTSTTTASGSWVTSAASIPSDARGGMTSPQRARMAAGVRRNRRRTGHGCGSIRLQPGRARRRHLSATRMAAAMRVDPIVSRAAWPPASNHRQSEPVAAGGWLGGTPGAGGHLLRVRPPRETREGLSGWQTCGPHAWARPELDFAARPRLVCVSSPGETLGAFIQAKRVAMSEQQQQSRTQQPDEEDDALDPRQSDPDEMQERPEPDPPSELDDTDEWGDDVPERGQGEDV